MTDRVFEDDRSFEVSGGGRSVEVHVFAGKITLTALRLPDAAGWDSQLVSFTMTAEEATMLKEFLIRKGY